MAIATATTLDVYAGGELLFASVSFKLEPRERMTLSGRNGAGKSTLLRSWSLDGRTGRRTMAGCAVRTRSRPTSTRPGRASTGSARPGASPSTTTVRH